MAELKNHIASLPYVLLCAYSVRRGLWFVVRLPDNQTPETLAAHFRYLQKLFIQNFWIALDTTKGGNPTDLRFVSYDAEPRINENATAMIGTYTPPVPTYQPVNYSPSLGKNDKQLLTSLVRSTQNAPDGQRHQTLRNNAIAAGGYIAAGRMDEQTAIYAFETVASEWPMFSKSQKTIRDGIRYGMKKPFDAANQTTHKQVNHTAYRHQWEGVTSTTFQEESVTKPAPYWNSTFTPPPFSWNGKNVSRFIRWAVIPDGYTEQNWPPITNLTNEQQ
ncbi:hypothetical protein [Spirosoma endophyticum]|nr:hypothetical protein [Spirosoma endophyticum]